MTESIPSFVVRFAVVGLGMHAESMLASFGQSRSARLLAAATTSPEKISRLEKKFSRIRLSTRYEDAVADPEIDCVYLALPNHLHAPWSILALEHGKHVLCEKPLCLSGEEAEALQRAAARQTRYILEAFAYRAHTQHEAAKALLRSGSIGEPRSISVRYHYTLSDRSNYRWDGARGGGALNDTGCYAVDLGRFLFGSEPYAAEGELFHSPGETVDWRAVFRLAFPGGRTVNASCSMADDREHSYRITGTEGQLTVPQAFHVKPLQKVTLLLQQGREPAQRLPQPPCDQFACFLDDVCVAIDNPASAKWAEDGLKNSVAMEMIRRACRTIEALPPR